MFFNVTLLVLVIKLKLPPIFFFQPPNPLFIVCGLLLNYVQLCATSQIVAHQFHLSMGFSRQEYWNGLLCPPSGDMPDPGIEPMSPMAPALQSDSLPLSHPGSQGLVGETDKSVITIWSENEQRVSSEGPLT